jgi:membrane protein
VVKRPRSHGQRFQLALETLQQLDRVRTTVAKGLTIAQLSLLLRVDELQLDPVLETLCELDWIGRLDEALPGETARYVLVADPDTTLLAPLLSALLLQYEDPTRNLWENSRWLSISLRKVL